jgi:branched-chain amino acid transport system substrate-binding protein
VVLYSSGRGGGASIAGRGTNRLDSLIVSRRTLLSGLSLLTLSACTGGGFDFGGPVGPINNETDLPLAQGQTFGTGPVRVALLLPLTGDAATVGTSMAHGAELAMDFIAQNANINDNITLVLKDTGDSVQAAAAAAQQAVGEGASLILGPLRADQVTAAGGVARSAGIPLIGFSNNSGAAQPGVYLLNVLPESEAKRSLGYAKSIGKRAFAGLFPNSDYGRIQQSAFTQAASELGIRVVGVYSFGSLDEAKAVVAQIAPVMMGGQIDTLFLPDRATAPSFGVLFEEAKVAGGAIQIIGSADWNGDQNISNTPWLANALYPAVDDAGYQALLPLYQGKFGGTPHPFVTLAYTGVVLANVSSLSLGTPKYDRAQLTTPGGFNGRDGVFRFLADGRSEYALVIKKVTLGGAQLVDAAKL